METDVELLGRLRDGDEDAFVTLVGRYQQPMLRLARTMVPSQAVAEEAVQDTWMGVVRGIERFEGRSSLRTWLFHILVNRARSAGSSEQRSGAGRRAGTRDAGSSHGDRDAPAVDPSFFDVRGSWLEPVVRWGDESDERLDAATMAPFLKAALDNLPPRQREVVLLRDLEGLSGAEVCDVLGVSSGNQRILLHRGRSQLRRELDSVVKGD
ncbi:MAG TPA: RNA polymerase sigma factor [Acidimicrobiales bacterium]|nr:RNA polymerase sigma factor [Acidimicrobiales bacterium]